MKGHIGKIDLNEYIPLSEVIFNKIREAIILGDLKPGERLLEIKLADKMGVSRTPVREAIRRLELEGLVIMLPRKGAHVANISVKNIKDYLEIRAFLDGFASSLSAERITEAELINLKSIQAQFVDCIKKGNLQGSIKKDVEFHDVIYQSSRNEKLMQIASNLKEQIQRFRIIYLKDDMHSVELIQEHSEILEALLSRNAEKAKITSEQHIIHQQQAIIESINNSNIPH